VARGRPYLIFTNCEQIVLILLQAASFILCALFLTALASPERTTRAGKTLEVGLTSAPEPAKKMRAYGHRSAKVKENHHSKRGSRLSAAPKCDVFYAVPLGDTHFHKRGMQGFFLFYSRWQRIRKVRTRPPCSSSPLKLFRSPAEAGERCY
jgi:hypothetical protein